VISKWKKAIIAPSNSFPPSDLIEIGERALHKIDSAVLQAMKMEIPDPNPYPF
jgi:hypothetical protein